MYALDSRIGEFLTPDGMSGRRERDRGRESYTVGPAGPKLDIKALEKILGKEKKLAKGIHEELYLIADRADVDMMVGFGNGSLRRLEADPEILVQTSPFARAVVLPHVDRSAVPALHLSADARVRRSTGALHVHLTAPARVFSFPPVPYITEWNSAM